MGLQPISLTALQIHLDVLALKRKKYRITYLKKKKLIFQLLAVTTKSLRIIEYLLEGSLHSVDLLHSAGLKGVN